MEKTRFSQWCIVEIMGHVRLAGLVTEETLAGQGFIRVDVPETPRAPAFTKLYGPGAIYCVSPVTEEVARAMAERFTGSPVEAWDIRAVVAKLPKAAGQGGGYGEEAQDV